MLASKPKTLNEISMKIYIGSDHRGFALKEQLKSWFAEQQVTVEDLGAQSHVDGDDYVDYAEAVAQHVQADPAAKGIVICGSGVGVDMVANKTNGIRSGLGIAHDQVIAARKDDDINVLAIAADYTLPEEVKKMVKAFLDTAFSEEERHKKRLEKVKELEAE
jgi:ribose 5-phosphate isomerase B